MLLFFSQLFRFFSGDELRGLLREIAVGRFFDPDFRLHKAMNPALGEGVVVLAVGGKPADSTPEIPVTDITFRTDHLGIFHQGLLGGKGP